MHKGTSFPVGKVQFLDLYPLNYKEFLMALGENELLRLLEERDLELIKVFKTKYIETLKQYYFIGGMPEVVCNFIENRDYKQAREIQNKILYSYEQDFSKHAPNDIVPKLRMIWNNIPSQLAKENKKFIYGLVREGARAREFELAMMWLIDCGLVYSISRISKPDLPLAAYQDFNSFKLFIVDTGLLGTMAGLDEKTLLEGDNIFTEFKGALTEQFVLQQLKSMKDISIFYWSAEKSKAEIDFIIQSENRVIPIDVKAEENLQAKSLKAFYEKYNNKNCIRTSMSDYREQEWIKNIPLYFINELLNLI